jgi:peptidoglycan/LPS O-acetylase OafA/YrhL
MDRILADRSASKVSGVRLRGVEERSERVAPGGDPGKLDRSRAGIPVVPAFDGFRAYAILGIVLFHLSGSTSLIDRELTRAAIYGLLPSMIEVLFIVSGFVVFLPAVVRGGSLGDLRNYAMRRAARLLPAYWLVLVVVVAMIAVWPIGDPNLPGVGSIAIHAAVLQIPATLVDQGFLVGFGVNLPLWTLSLEVLFYALLPLIAAAYLRRPIAGLLIAAVISIGWKLATVHAGWLASLVGWSVDPGSLESFRLAADNQLPAFAFCFALGMTGAWAYVRLTGSGDAPRVRRIAGRAQLGSLLVLVVCAYLFGRFAIDTDSGFPVHFARRDLLLAILFPAALAAFMLATTLTVPRRQVPFALPTSRRLGDISYGIYLIHLPMILFMTALLPGLVDRLGAFAAMMLTAIPLTVLYGWASARFFEQPIRRWAQRFGRRVPGGDRAAAAPSEPRTG